MVVNSQFDRAALFGKLIMPKEWRDDDDEEGEDDY